METRLNCPGVVGPFGRVSPSLIAAERTDRKLIEGANASFKQAVGKALDELDIQAENGQLTSGAYMQVANKLKKIYDSQVINNDAAIRKLIVQIAVQEPTVLHSVPDGIEWFTPGFLEDLLCEAAEVLQSDIRNNTDRLSKDRWIDQILNIYLDRAEDPELFWNGFDILSQTIPRVPLCLGSQMAQEFGKYLIGAVYKNTSLDELEPFTYFEVEPEEVMEFWEEKARKFPSDYTLEFITDIFEDAKANEPAVLVEIRKGIKENIQSGFERRCKCATCSQLFAKPKPNEKNGKGNK